ncbi:putative uncharacterized protein [Eubacterium sp. CAG:786]|nr:putative uncharacterized protein [Eubacterium sp. CAG:786]
MSDLFSGFAQELSEKARNANPEPEKQYMGEDGFLHCSICHEPVQMKAPEECRNIFPSGIMDKHCRCVRERIERDEAERKRRKAEERIAELQRICFTDPAYMRHTFEQDKGYSPAARKVAEWYVDTYHERRANNEGLMFMGDTGTGKTFFACCIANALIRKGVAVWVTTMQPLLRKAGDFSKADEVMHQVQSIDLLILDDFGTSQNSARNLDLMFEIIDTRARSGLPLIITTNLAPHDFKEPPLELKRIYSRIKEMCWSSADSPVRMSGADLREIRAKSAHNSGK